MRVFNRIDRPNHHPRSDGGAFLLAGVVSLLTFFLSPAFAQFGESSYVVPLDDETINYDRAPLADPITKLQKWIADGKVKLQHDEKHGFLPALLRELKIPVSSQVLVFSKTSFQLRRISPHRPRALYFNEEVYIGRVQDSEVIEISAVDPNLGGVFFTLEPDAKGRPKFTRTADCLQCHASARTAGVPGHIVRSLFTDPEGFPMYQAGSSSIDHRSPIEERWGGYYVTGKSPHHGHLGNQTFKKDTDTERPDRTLGANVTDLDKYFDTKAYLSPHSDIVALMVLEHQVRMHNLITAVNYESKRAMSYQRVLNEALNQPADEVGDTTKRRFKSASDALLKYLLFVDEAELKGPIEGTSGFAEAFAKQGPRDSKGRSLRELDLKTRMFKYPCSYLIHCEAFDAIDKPMRGFLLQRLHDILTGKDTSEEFANLKAEDRKAVLEILRETKKDLPGYWHKRR
ncbi:MAG: hypothetical protein WD768_09790 [Phycisphaeraceae bacterium]